MSLPSRRMLLWACVLTLLAAESASAQFFNFGSFNFEKLNHSPRVLAARRQQIGSMIQDAQADGKIDAKEKQSILYFANATLPKEEAKAVANRLDGARPAVILVGSPGKSGTSATSGRRSDLVSTSYAEGVASSDETPASKPGSLVPSPVGDPDPAVEGFDTGVLSTDCTDGCDMGCDPCCDAGCDCQMMGCLIQSETPWDNLKLFSSLDAFKGPMDLGNRNANFGIRFGANLGVPVLPTRNIGFQIGTTETVADFNGTEYTSDTCRWQNFTTIAFLPPQPVRTRPLQLGLRSRLAARPLLSHNQTSAVADQGVVQLGLQQ